MMKRLPKKFFFFAGGGLLLVVVLAFAFSLLSTLFLKPASTSKVGRFAVPGSALQPLESGGFNLPGLPTFDDSSAKVSRETQRTSQTQTTAAGELTEKKVIRTASLTMQADDVPATAGALEGLAGKYEGFVQDASISQDFEGRWYGQVILRIPAAVFGEALKASRALAKEIEHDRVSGQDVTEEFVDLEARLRNLRATEIRYLDILEKAKTIEDILKVEAQLKAVRGEIEVTTGRINFLERQTDMATITITLKEVPEAALMKIGDWDPIVTLKNAWRTILNSAQNLGKFIVWFVTYGVIVLVYAAVILIPATILLGRLGPRALRIFRKLWGGNLPPPPPPR